CRASVVSQCHSIDMYRQKGGHFVAVVENGHRLWSEGVYAERSVHAFVCVSFVCREEHYGDAEPSCLADILQRTFRPKDTNFTSRGQNFRWTNMKKTPWRKTRADSRGSQALENRLLLFRDKRVSISSSTKTRGKRTPRSQGGSPTVWKSNPLPHPTELFHEMESVPKIEFPS
ncbi:hypothetical protein BaRGS_00008680, partial [Batillaria attramentaria]